MEARLNGQTFGQFPLPVALCWQRVEESSRKPKLHRLHIVSTEASKYHPRQKEHPDCPGSSAIGLLWGYALEAPLRRRTSCVGGKAGQNWLATPACAWCRGPSLDFSVRRKSKPIFAKSLRAVISQIRKRKVHEKSKPMASLSLIPFPFALHSLSSSRLAVTHGNTNQNKTKTKGRRVSYTNSSQVHKVSP